MRIIKYNNKTPIPTSKKLIPNFRQALNKLLIISLLSSLVACGGGSPSVSFIQPSSNNVSSGDVYVHVAASDTDGSIASVSLYVPDMKTTGAQWSF